MSVGKPVWVSACGEHHGAVGDDQVGITGFIAGFECLDLLVLGRYSFGVCMDACFVVANSG